MEFAVSQKRSKIINATIQLFLSEGIKKTTMDDIAAYAMCSKVTIYTYFRDKDDLFIQIGKQIFAEQIKEVNKVWLSEEDLVTKLYDFIDIIAAFSDTGKYAICEELIRIEPELESEYENYIETYENFLNALVDLATESGMIAPQLTHDMIFHYIDMGIQYYRGNEMYRNRLHIDNTFREQFMSFLIGNIFTDTHNVKST